MLYFKYFFLLTFIFVLFSCQKDDDFSGDTTSTFSGEIDWVKTYGGSSEEEAVSVIEAIEGGYVVLGFTRSTDGDIMDKTTTDSDLWVLRLSDEGEILWSKTYGGSMDDRGTKIINTLDGGFAISGYARSNDGDVSGNAGFYDYWLIKLNSVGTLLWQKTYGFSGNDQAQSVIQTSDGGFFLTGFLDVGASGGAGNTGRSSNKHGVGEFWGIKTDSNGEMLWSRYFGGMDNDRSYDVAETENGGFILIGNTESDDFDITDPKGSYDFWAVRINSSGDLLWAKNYGGSQIEIAYEINKTSDGNYLLAGDTRSSDGDVTGLKGNADAWLVKINGNGQIIWQKTLGGSAYDTARSIDEFDDDKLLITGASRSADGDVSNNYGDSDIWAAIVDPAGNLQWESNFGGSAFDFGNTGIITSDNKAILAGSSESDDGDVTLNRGLKDLILIKLK